jgi:hypothetical protein
MNLSNFTLSDNDAITWCVNALDKACTTENELHIRQNMIGDVPWSMKNILRNKSRCASGFISTLSLDDTLVGIAGCEKTSEIFPNSIQFGIRLWVNPQFRGKIGTLSLLLAPAVDWASQEKAIVWASFNSDRQAMLRMIQVRAKESSEHISELWTGFKHLPEQVLVFNTQQWIAYKDFSKL